VIVNLVCTFPTVIYDAAEALEKLMEFLSDPFNLAIVGGIAAIVLLR
jgi:hypothetical protein